MAGVKILEIFLKCPNCNRYKNVNYTKKDIEAKATCFCGTKLVKKINS